MAQYSQELVAQAKKFDNDAAPAKMRVHAFAKELGVSSKEMMQLLADVDMPVKAPASTITTQQRQQFLDQLVAEKASEEVGDVAAEEAAEEKPKKQQKKAKKTAKKSAEKAAKKTAKKSAKKKDDSKKAAAVEAGAVEAEAVKVDAEQVESEQAAAGQEAQQPEPLVEQVVEATKDQPLEEHPLEDRAQEELAQVELAQEDQADESEKDAPATQSAPSQPVFEKPAKPKRRRARRVSRKKEPEATESQDPATQDPATQDAVAQDSVKQDPAAQDSAMQDTEVAQEAPEQPEQEQRMIDREPRPRRGRRGRGRRRVVRTSTTQLAPWALSEDEDEAEDTKSEDSKKGKKKSDKKDKKEKNGKKDKNGKAEKPGKNGKKKSKNGSKQDPRSDKDDQEAADQPDLAHADTSGEETDVDLIEEPRGLRGSTRLEAQRRRREERRAQQRRRHIISEAEFLARRESVERTMVVRERRRHDHQGNVTQVAVLEDDMLVEHFVTSETQTSQIGNIYLGRVQNVLPSMEAAFIDIGTDRNAVLYAGDIDWREFGGAGRSRRVEQVLKSGDQILVQVTKDPIGHKGARLSTQISLAGRFLVYVPHGRTSGISRKLPEAERRRLKAIVKEVSPKGSAAIIRTAAEGVEKEHISQDVARLQRLWEDIERRTQEEKSSRGSKPVTMYEEPNMLVKVVRDLFNEDFSALVVEGQRPWSVVKGYVDEVAPDLSERLSQYRASEHGDVDVFEHYRIDEQISKALARKVWLPSGGTLVIDRTEAMTVIDVNTGKFTGVGGNLEETITKNNLEAAEEIVRQMRLRDLGGMIVVDFVDMVLPENQELVLRRLKEFLGRDRTRHEVSEVTSLGLVQMTRKRLGTGLVESFSTRCTECQGRGIIIHTDPVEPNSDELPEPRPPKRSKRKNPQEHPVAKAMHSDAVAEANAEQDKLDDAARAERKRSDKAVSDAVDALIVPSDAPADIAPEDQVSASPKAEKKAKQEAQQAVEAVTGEVAGDDADSAADAAVDEASRSGSSSRRGRRRAVRRTVRREAPETRDEAPEEVAEQQEQQSQQAQQKQEDDKQGAEGTSSSRRRGRRRAVRWMSNTKRQTQAAATDGSANNDSVNDEVADAEIAEPKGVSIRQTESPETAADNSNRQTYDEAVAEFEASPRRKRPTRGNSRSDHAPKREDYADESSGGEEHSQRNRSRSSRRRGRRAVRRTSSE